MNWEAIGAVGEIIGAGAVVVTLIYLSTQLRQNTRTVEHSIQRGVYQDGNAWLEKIIENPELAELYRAGMREEELSSNDRFRFGLLVGQLFMHWNHAYETGAFDIVDNAQIPGLLAQTGGANWWKRASSTGSVSFHPDFVDFVNRKLAEVQGAGDESKL